MISRVTWFDEAMNDPALFQATILSSALHHATFYHEALTESLDLCLATTSLVNAKLNDPELGISDNNIAAVICLSFFEVSALVMNQSCDQQCLQPCQYSRIFLAMSRLQMYTWKAYKLWWSEEVDL